MPIDRDWWLVIILPPVSPADTGQYFVPCPAESDRTSVEGNIWRVWPDARISYVPRSGYVTRATRERLIAKSVR